MGLEEVCPACVCFDVIFSASRGHHLCVDVVRAYHDHEVLFASLACDGEAAREVCVAQVGRWDDLGYARDGARPSGLGGGVYVVGGFIAGGREG